MTEVPEDFKQFLPKDGEREPDWDGPLYWLWVYDPQDGKVHVDHNKDRHPADHVTHQDMNPEVVHPGRLNGYAYKIKGGYRVTTDKHKVLDDPFVLNLVKKELNRKHPVKLPKVK